LEIQLAILEGTLESRHKLAAKNTPEHFDGEERTCGVSDPVGVVEGRPPAGTTQWTCG